MSEASANLVPDGMVRCEVTGELIPATDVVEVMGHRVGAEGKAILLDRMASGRPLPGELQHPGFVRRGLCRMLDGVIVSLIGGTLMIVLLSRVIGSMATGGGDTLGPHTIAGVIGLVVILSQVLATAYFVVMHAIWGQTLGKMLGRVHVVTIDRGEKPGLKQIVIRELLNVGVWMLPGLVMCSGFLGANLETALIAGYAMQIPVQLYVLVSVVLAATDRQRQRALHDRAAGTRVIWLEEDAE